jgi:N-acetylglutamate synthase-like GNAT family acetyltransferase
MVIRLLREDDAVALEKYFASLSADAKSFFNPHPLNADEARKICNALATDTTMYRYVMLDDYSGEIISYMIITRIFSMNDSKRLLNAGIKLDKNDCCFAPSIHDDFGARGLGAMMVDYIVKHLKENGMKRVFLLGGVEVSNNRALRFYTRHGFSIVNFFHRNHRQSLNMVLDL